MKVTRHRETVVALAVVMAVLLSADIPWFVGGLHDDQPWKMMRRAVYVGQGVSIAVLLFTLLYVCREFAMPALLVVFAATVYGSTYASMQAICGVSAYFLGHASSKDGWLCNTTDGWEPIAMFVAITLILLVSLYRWRQRAQR